MCAFVQQTEDINIDIKDVVKHKQRQLVQIIQLHYGLLDQLVSQGTCDLEDIKVIEYTEASILHRKHIITEMLEKLTSNPAQRKQILDILRIHKQRHVAEFIEHKGCEYIVQLATCCAHC